jgi:nucleoid DNA-binding protein
MALTKSELVGTILEYFEDGEVSKRAVADILDVLAEIGQEELGEGESFTIPGLVKIDWAYAAPRTKGQMYKRGETYVGFGGVEQTAEADSKPRKASFKIRATPAAPIKRLAPKKDAMSKFGQSRLGKAVAARKG